jgi:integrase
MRDGFRYGLPRSRPTPYLRHASGYGESAHPGVTQELPGHKTLAMTQRYSHLVPERLQSAVKLPDGVIGERWELFGEVLAQLLSRNDDYTYG